MDTDRHTDGQTAGEQRGSLSLPCPVAMGGSWKDSGVSQWITLLELLPPSCKLLLVVTRRVPS